MDVELAQLRQLLDDYRPLVTKCSTTDPDTIELSALAAMLHAYYTGIENIMKRVAIEVDGALPGGENWHRQLLEIMSKPGALRPEVIGKELRQVLTGYLDFRHVFRHAYTFQLRWLKMRLLVLGCERTLGELEAQLAQFLAASPPP